jgi:hypothetical protein
MLTPPMRSEDMLTDMDVRLESAVARFSMGLGGIVAELVLSSRFY